MTRSGVRNFTMLVLLALVIMGGLLYWQVQKVKVSIETDKSTLASKYSELNNLTALGQAQDKIDSLTIDERVATQLDILRYLGLERRDLNFTISSRESRPAGDTDLIVRTILVQTNADYGETMALLDQLYGGGKLNITSIDLRSNLEDTVPNKVMMNLRAILYGLHKRGDVLETSLGGSQ